MNIGMPRAIDVGSGYTIRVTGLDPATGNVVAGVKTTQVVMEVEGEGDLSSGNFVVANPILLGVGL